MITINGEKVAADGQTVAAYLQSIDCNPQSVAVEYNDAILPRSQYENQVLADGDVVEIVHFVGGGC